MLNRELFDKAVTFHGHSCPGLAVGFKACEGAIKELGLDASKVPAIDEELVCVTENDACGVDAIQVLLGCTYGKGNLIPRLRGKHVYTFFNRSNGRGVRLVFIGKNEASLSRDEYQHYLLSTPFEKLFVCEKPRFALPETARKFPSYNCVVCGEPTAEYALKVQRGSFVCPDCYDGYQREDFS